MTEEQEVQHDGTATSGSFGGVSTGTRWVAVGVLVATAGVSFLVGRSVGDDHPRFDGGPFAHEQGGGFPPGVGGMPGGHGMPGGGYPGAGMPGGMPGGGPGFEGGTQPPSEQPVDGEFPRPPLPTEAPEGAEG